MFQVHRKCHELHEAISGLHYKNAMDIEHLLNYPSENNMVMESLTEKKIIQGVIDIYTYDDHDSDDNCVLLNVSPKDAFQAIVTLNYYLLQYIYIYTNCSACFAKKKN